MLPVPIRPLLFRVMLVLSWAYAGLLAVWLLLRALLFDQLWWLALANTLALYLLLPLLIVVPLALIGRARRLLLALTPPCVAFVMLFGDLLVPPVVRPAQGAAGPALTAMTFNLLWDNADDDAIVRAIRAAAPDIIGFQEVTAQRAAALAGRLRDAYPYHTFGAGSSAALASRWPIRSFEPLSDPPFERAMRAEVAVGGRAVVVAVAHLTPNNMQGYPPEMFVDLTIDRYTRRMAETVALRDLVLQSGRPAVLLCDCNMTDTSETYGVLRSVLRDSFREAGWGLGHSLYANGLPFPVQRVDYIWHTPDLVARRADVGVAGGSDHLPVVAVLHWAQ
jgi:vancomycin resistance protein VanJ